MHKIAAAAGTTGLITLAYFSPESRGLAAAALALLLALMLLEAKYQKDRLGRKTVHFLGGIGVAFFMLLAGAKTASAWLAATTILLVAASKLLRKGKYLPLFSEGIENFERKGVPPLYGSINFFLGSALAAALFPASAAAGMLAVGAGDAFSTVVGMHFGRTKIGKKSLEGSAAFFAATLIACIQILPPEKAVLAAAAGAAIELLPIGVDDNITIPVGVAGILGLLA